MGLTVLGEENRTASRVRIPPVSKKEENTVHPVAQTVLGGEERTAYPVAPAMAQKNERVYSVAPTVMREEKRVAYLVALAMARKKEKTAHSLPPPVLREEETTAYPVSLAILIREGRTVYLVALAMPTAYLVTLVLLTVYAVALAVWSAEEKVLKKDVRMAHPVTPKVLNKQGIGPFLTTYPVYLLPYLVCFLCMHFLVL